MKTGFKHWFDEHADDGLLRQEYKAYVDGLEAYDEEPPTFPRWMQLKYEATESK